MANLPLHPFWTSGKVDVAQEYQLPAAAQQAAPSPVAASIHLPRIHIRINPGNIFGGRLGRLFGRGGGGGKPPKGDDEGGEDPRRPQPDGNTPTDPPKQKEYPDPGENLDEDSKDRSREPIMTPPPRGETPMRSPGPGGDG